MIAAALPARPARGEARIDWLGAALLAGGAGCLVVVTSLGGTTWDWGSVETIVTAALGVALLAAFGVVERRATDPVLPLALFRTRVFAVAAALAFIVGFAMFGATTFLPLFFQVVFGQDPTTSGLQLLPLMGGLLVTSLISGQVISRTGRYKPFPVAGTAIITAGFALLSTMDAGVSTATVSLYIALVGIGLGMTMQVIVLAAQNSAAYRNLGVVTSSVTFLRSMGGAIGVAIFGAIFSNRLVAELGGAASPAAPIRPSCSGCRRERARRSPAATRTRLRPSSSPPRRSPRSRSCSAWRCARSRCARRSAPRRPSARSSRRSATPTRCARSSARCARRPAATRGATSSAGWRSARMWIWRPPSCGRSRAWRSATAP